MRARTGHVVEKLVLVAVHDGRTDDGRLREGLLDALLALELGAVERGLGVRGSVEMRDVHETLDTLLLRDVGNAGGAVGVYGRVVEVPEGAYINGGYKMILRDTHLVS